jgi:type I restriction enzyme M protein
MILSEPYESLLKQVAADSPGYAGEFYSPRHIIRAMVRVVRPRIGDRIYDPCFGSAGFHAESADYIVKTTPHMSGDDLHRLQHATFYGVEFKPLSYLLGTMNMILHGIESANFELANTLELHSQNVPESRKYTVKLSNPPCGGKLDRSLQTNFTIHSRATEILFVQHIMANLAVGGRAGVIVPEGVLFRSGPDAKVRERLLKEFNVHTVLSLPAGCFMPYAGVKTNVLFFNREMDGKTTKDVWFYELTNDGFELKQTRKPIEGDQFPDFLAKWEKRVCGENSWILPLAEIEKRGWDLSAKNPNRAAEADQRKPLELVESIKAKQERIAELADELEEILTGDE